MSIKNNLKAAKIKNKLKASSVVTDMKEITEILDAMMADHNLYHRYDDRYFVVVDNEDNISCLLYYYHVTDLLISFDLSDIVLAINEIYGEKYSMVEAQVFLGLAKDTTTLLDFTNKEEPENLQIEGAQNAIEEPKENQSYHN